MAMAAGGSVQRGSKLMVTSLPNYFTEEELKSMFSTFGEVHFVRVCRNKTTNASLGYGFVEYVKPADAAKAIEQVDGLQLGNKKMKVSYPQPVGDDVKNATKVFVRRLPNRYDEENMKELFGKYGKVVKARLIRDSVTNKSKTVGYVFFERWNDAQRAVTELNGFQPEGAQNKLQVLIQENELAPSSRPASAQVRPYSNPRPRQQPDTRFQQIPSHVTNTKGCSNVFLYNIGEFATEQEIYNLFAQFGGLLKIDIVRDPTTKMCKGYAFLTFETRASAENAIFTMDGMMYRGRLLQVRYKHG